MKRTNRGSKEISTVDAKVISINNSAKLRMTQHILRIFVASFDSEDCHGQGSVI